MSKTSSGAFINTFHKWSGLLLILFIALKILSGYAVYGMPSIFSRSTGGAIHFARWVDIPLLFLFIYHAVYGVLKVFTKFNTRNKPVVFWLTTLVATFLFVILVLFVYLV